MYSSNLTISMKTQIWNNIKINVSCSMNQQFAALLFFVCLCIYKDFFHIFVSRISSSLRVGSKCFDIMSLTCIATRVIDQSKADNFIKPGIMPFAYYKFTHLFMPQQIGIGDIQFTHVCSYIPHLVSAQWFKFSLSKSFEIYAQYQGP